MALLADRPGVHLLRHMAERRNFADGVKVLAALTACDGLSVQRRRHGPSASDTALISALRKSAPGSYCIAIRFTSQMQNSP